MVELVLLTGSMHCGNLFQLLQQRPPEAGSPRRTPTDSADTTQWRRRNCSRGWIVWKIMQYCTRTKTILAEGLETYRDGVLPLRSSRLICPLWVQFYEQTQNQYIVDHIFLLSILWTDVLCVMACSMCKRSPTILSICPGAKPSFGPW